MCSCDYFKWSHTIVDIVYREEDITIVTPVLTKAEKDLLRENLYECIIYPGDVLYFPAMWMHATLNLDPYNVFISLFIDVQLMKS